MLYAYCPKGDVADHGLGLLVYMAQRIGGPDFWLVERPKSNAELPSQTHGASKSSI